MVIVEMLIMKGHWNMKMRELKFLKNSVDFDSAAHSLARDQQGAWIVESLLREGNYKETRSKRKIFEGVCAHPTFIVGIRRRRCSFIGCEKISNRYCGICEKYFCCHHSQLTNTNLRSRFNSKSKKIPKIKN